MRTIKFRAWQDDKMYHQDSPGVYGTKKFLDTLYEDCELMQFTGLTDKNGTEIFESDILLIDGGNHKMVFWNGCFMLDDYDNGDYYQGTDPTHTNYDTSEVVGNIHENHELLK